MRFLSPIAFALLALIIARPGLAQNPPPDATLFKTVAGKWGWKESDTVSCSANPHTIAFPNAKTMTITFAKPFKSATGATTSATTYDVLYAETNKITAMIEGEMRRTDAGDRVVWVLILKDANTYAWRRTDWRADGMTKEIERCQ